MRAINNHLIFVLIVNLLFLFPAVSSCAKTTPKVVVVLFDISRSTSQKQRGADSLTPRERYFNDFKELLLHMKESDVIKGGAITGRSGSEGGVINIDFPRSSLFTSREEIKEQMEERRIQALQQAIDVLHKTSPETDIFGAIRQSAEVFKQYPDYRHILVIFSDMVQESQEYKMSSNGPPDGEASRLVESWRQRGGVPQLKGVDVYVWGASYPDERARIRIENFWRDLFSATGSRLQEYAPRMIRFRE